MGVNITEKYQKWLFQKSGKSQNKFRKKLFDNFIEHLIKIGQGNELRC